MCVCVWCVCVCVCDSEYVCESVWCVCGCVCGGVVWCVCVSTADKIVLMSPSTSTSKKNYHTTFTLWSFTGFSALSDSLVRTAFSDCS